jgi:periplasmic divalent cation tolerance protein
MAEPTHLVYITAPNRDVALAIARAVVEERLAACANVLGEIASVYWWNGGVHQDAEVALIAKTRDELVAPLTDRIRQLHPYECPCIVAWPLSGGNPAFHDWIRAETRK